MILPFPAGLLVAALASSLQPPPEPATAWVEGRVVDSATRMPLAGVLVVLQRTDSSYSVGEDRWKTEPANGEADPAAQRRAVTTADDGRYRFRVTVPSKFLLFAHKAGYVRESSGISGELKTPGSTTQLQIALVPESRLEGRVVDRETGRPVQGMGVAAWGQWDKAPKGTFIPLGSDPSTDEEGKFVIERLPPGEYFLEARPAIKERIRGAGPEEDFRRSVRLGYGPTWYPDAATREESSPVRLLGGSTVDRVELKVERKRFAAIRGKLTLDESAAGVEKVTLMLVRLRHGWDGRGYFTEALGEVRPGGYEIQQLGSGQYWLSARIAGKTRADHQAAHLIFDVRDENLDHVDLHLMKGFTVTGRVRMAPMEGPPPDEVKPIERAVKVSLSSTRRASTRDEFQPVETEPVSGEFSIDGVFPDEYMIHVAPPPGLLQAEITYNNTPLPHRAVKIESATDRRHLEILMRPPGGSLSVTVTDGTNPVAEAQVLVMPEPVHEDAARSIRLRAKTDAEGRATIPQMLAGAYRVIAFAGGNEWSSDARLLDRFRAAPQVKISGGGQQTVQIRPEPQ